MSSHGNTFAISLAKPLTFDRLPARTDTFTDVMLDEFDSTELDSDWIWVEPLEGPSWSLSNNPGFFQFTVPPGHESWSDSNTAPSLQRSDMGAGDFAVEMSYAVQDTAGDWYDSGLMVGFSETDRRWVGLIGDDLLGVGDSEGSFFDVDVDTGAPVFLRIEKNGMDYAFLYKQNEEDAWTHLDSYTIPQAVSYVGVFGDSYGTADDVTYDVDYFRIENTITSASLGVTVLNTDAVPQEGLRVYVYDDSSSDTDPLYTGFNGMTDATGRVSFDLPLGLYRFRADLNGTQFWSDEGEECRVPACDQVEITVSKPVTVTVLDSASAPKEGLKVYAFDETRYTGYSRTTDANGQVEFTLPLGSYHFRADLNGTQFWSSAENHCAVPGCTSASIAVSLPVTVTVLDTDSVPKAGLNVYAFDETTYSGYHVTANSNGQAVFTLPFGTYRFRADLNGTQFWSGAENHCDSNAGCAAVGITVTKPVAVTVLDTVGTPYSNLPVYAFDGTTYTGYHATTNAQGKATLTLPLGDYHFRADLNGTQFWNSTENNCSVPGCTTADISLPGSITQTETTIEYTYDLLNRLTRANYSTGDFYAYTYDAVGNRLTQDSSVLGLSSPVSYTYDIANRLTDVNGVAYTYDANGNLLNDGLNTYAYDSANRLTSVNGAGSYTYNGMGDRLSQNGVNYTLDLNTGLTQVLSDGTTTYTYGLGRISQQLGSTPEYFLGDALGSVRQLTSQSGAVTYAASYDPYGVVTQSGGASNTEYGFTGESQGTYGDSTQLIFLRARWYNPADGRFLTKDPSGAEANLYLYAKANPITYSDPTGYFTQTEITGSFYGWSAGIPWSWFLNEWGSIERKKWGFLAALLDASPGDRLEAYRYKIDAQRPNLEKVADVTLSLGVIDNGSSSVGTITANNIGLKQFFRDSIYYGGVKFAGLNVENYRGLDARYYFLHKRNGGTKFYIDGSLTTDYPDYKVVSLGVSDAIKASNGVKALLKDSLKCGITYSASVIIDRYGSQYLMVTGGLGVGVSLGSYGEGYITNRISTAPQPMKNQAELQKNIVGVGLSASEVIGLGHSAGIGWTIWDKNTPKSFVYMQGVQASASIEVVNVFPPFSSDSALGWQWASQAESQGYVGKAYFGSDF
jgi:RHS repeat-associated protein